MLRRAPQLAVLLAGGCGFLHGLAHGRELAGMASGAGFLLASALVMGWAPWSARTCACRCAAWRARRSARPAYACWRAWSEALAPALSR
jgi:hydrogenase/urease accessory protein HupE